jgi:uncharacterized protein
MKKFSWLLIVSLFLFLCSCSNILYDARNGNIERIETELNHGFSIETKNQRGDTPLIVAAYSNKPDTVEYLCKKGADVNAKNYNGATALIYAAYYNLLDVAKVLVKYNADKSIKDRYGNTPLSYASQFEYTRMISLLEGK